MPVATAENFVNKSEKPRVAGRQRRKSTSILNAVVENSEVGIHADGSQATASSYLPRHSPILNLSPNMSPESHPDSSSPVFELLDSNQRRTVQGS